MMINLKVLTFTIFLSFINTEAYGGKSQVGYLKASNKGNR